MSTFINSNNLYSVDAAENQPVIVVAGIAIPVGLLVSGSSDVDLSEVTVTADDILLDKVAIDSQGNKIIGTIPNAAKPTVTNNVVTIHPGYQPTELKITVEGGGSASGVDELELFDWITIMSNY